MSQFLQYYKTVEGDSGNNSCKKCSIKIDFTNLKTLGTSLKAHIMNKHPHLLATEDEPTPKAPENTDICTGKANEFLFYPSWIKWLLLFVAQIMCHHFKSSMTQFLNGDLTFVDSTGSEWQTE